MKLARAIEKPMQSLAKIGFLLLLLGLLPQASAQTAAEPVESPFFVNLYSEGNYLGASHDLVGFGHLRAGRRYGDFELYGAVRISTDTASDFRPLGQVYNDNFLFAGLGADYVPHPLRWLRLRVQAGRSFNLDGNAVRPDGFDLLAGWVTYSEFSLSKPFLLENYSEGFYYHRYRNGIADNQLRLLWRGFESRSGAFTLSASPITMAVLNLDTAGVDYNRFFDWRTGVRFSARSASSSFSLTPMYVVDLPLQGRREYGEFRLLGVAYFEF